MPPSPSSSPNHYTLNKVGGIPNIDRVDDHGLRPLDYALENEHTDVAEYLDQMIAEGESPTHEKPVQRDDESLDSVNFAVQEVRCTQNIKAARGSENEPIVDMAHIQYQGETLPPFPWY